MSMRRNGSGRILIVAMLLAWTAGTAGAQRYIPSHVSTSAPESSDVIRGRARPVGYNATYFVGQPVVLRLTLSNHTRQKVHLWTNFIPQSYLSIDIMTTDTKRAYTGPYEPGEYMQIGYTLLPLDEYSDDVVIWSDPTRPSGLAFDTPGVYNIQISLGVQIQETNRTGRVPFNMVQIQIVPTPPAYKPMIDRLTKLGAFKEIQMRRIPKGSTHELEDILATTPPNALFPYIFLALASDYTFVLANNPQHHDQIFEIAFKYFQIAAQSDSAYKMSAYLEMLRFLNGEEKSMAAYQMCQLLLKQMPAEWHGRVGGFGEIGKDYKGGIFFPQLLKKYLINTPELDREKYWVVEN